MSLLKGKVIIVTGAGRGVGRSHALLMAKEGARLVINDIGADVRGEGTSASIVDNVVEEIRSFGGEAVGNNDDISDWQGARRVIQTGLDVFGRIDGLLNNAGNLRKQELADLTEQDIDSLFRVHVKGSFGCAVHALNYWRDRYRKNSTTKAAIVNTISEALLVSLPNYVAYGAAKGAIAHLTTCGSREALQYGVRINAYGPRAITRMTPGADEAGTGADEPVHPMDPGNSSPLVAWLLSDQSAHVSGQVFHTVGGGIAKCAPWTAGELVWPPDDALRFLPEQVGQALNSAIFRSRFPDMVLTDPKQSRDAFKARNA